VRGYDTVIDTQGLVRTALMTKLIHGTSHGYDADSVREPFAARFYDNTHRVDWDLHVIARNRALTGLALGYEPQGEPDFGFDRAAFKGEATEPYAILFHATAKTNKEWPEERWIEVGRYLSARGLRIFLPWGNDAEKARSERIATQVPNAMVPERRPIMEVGKLIAAIFTIVKSHTALPVGPGRVEMAGAESGIPEAAAVLAAVERLEAV
jgi:heptosyltransferase I